MATATPRLMGAEVKRKEDPRLVTGTSTYVGDINIPGLHYVAFSFLMLHRAAPQFCWSS